MVTHSGKGLRHKAAGALAEIEEERARLQEFRDKTERMRAQEKRAFATMCRWYMAQPRMMGLSVRIKLACVAPTLAFTNARTFSRRDAMFFLAGVINNLPAYCRTF